MKRPLLIGIGILIVGLLAWLGYRQRHPAGSSIASVMPAGALLELASNHLQDTVSAQTQTKQLTLAQLPIFGEARQRLDACLYGPLDSATVQQFLKGRDISYSLHSISNTTLDFIFYIPISNRDQAVLTQLTNPDPRRHRMLSHTYSGEKILDLAARSGEAIGSFLLTDHFLIGSRSGILIENVAKRMHQTLASSGKVPNLNAESDSWARLAIRPEVVHELFDPSGSLVRVFLPESINLQFRPSTTNTHLIGYASDDIGNRTDIAALFNDQTPQRIKSADLIPQSTATLYHIGLSDARRFGLAMSKLMAAASDESLRDRFRTIENATPPLYRALGNEILLCRLESSSGLPQQVMILPSANAKNLAMAYQQAALKAGQKSISQPKDFLAHKILSLSIPELPATLLSSLFLGFRQSWITQHGNAVIVANSEEAMNEYLQHLQRKTVWAADNNQSELLSKTLRPANFTAFVRLNRLAADGSHSAITAGWPTAWQNLLDDPDRPGHFANLDNLAYQASYGNRTIQSTLVVGRTVRRASKAVLNKVFLQKKTELETEQVASPLVTGSLTDGAVPFLAQTAGNVLSYGSAYGDISRQGALDGPMLSNTLSVDFLHNGRLQYLFMTQRSLYVADPRLKNGSLRAIRLPNGLNPTLLIRPRGSLHRNWLALATDADGTIYALDREKQAFVAIAKPSQKGALMLPFQAIPTPTGMDLIGIQANGTLYHWHENGRLLPHFPVKLERINPENPELSVSGPALLPLGQTQLQTISDEGELLKINPNGLIANRTQLYRPVHSGTFRLFPDEAQTNWLLLRASDTELAVLDQQGNLKFQVQALPSSERNRVRYHRLGAGVEVISVLANSHTTLYTPDGKVIGDRAIPSDFPVALQFDERTNELYVLSGSKRLVQLFSIRLR